MDIKVDINAEVINKAVVDAIINSTLGVQIENAIKEELKKLSGWNYNYQKTFENVIHCEVEKLMRNLVQTQYKEMVETVVKEKLSEQFTSELVGKLFDNWVNSKY